MLRKFCILDLSKHWAVIRGLRFLPDICNADIHKSTGYNYAKNFYNSPFIIRVSCWRVFRSLWPLCLMRQDQRSCEFARNWSLFVVFTAGARTVKMYYFARLWYHLKQACIWKKRLDLTISGKHSIKLSLPMLRSAPYLWLVMYWQSTLSDYVEKLVGGTQKHQLL